MSGPTLPVDHVASTNGLASNGCSACASTAANIAALQRPARPLPGHLATPTDAALPFW